MNGDDLKGIIIDAGMTQAEFAEALGVNLSTVKRWLNGDIEIPGPVWVIARLLQNGTISRPQLKGLSQWRAIERIPF